MNFTFERATDEEMQSVGKRGAKQKWPLSYMSVGDAINIKEGEYGKTSPSTYPHVYGKTSGKKFSVRHIGGHVYRIIRVS